jgi:hypothetical protein
MIHEYGKPRWNDTDREKPKKSEKTLSQFHFVHQNPTWTDPGAILGLSDERLATNRLNQ